MNPEDRKKIEAGLFFVVTFPGGYFLASRARFNPMTNGINFTLGNKEVGHIEIDRVEKILGGGAVVNIKVV